MALQSIRLGGFAGVKQGACAGLVPLNWAENAQNVSTTGGRLSRVKGYRTVYPLVMGETRKLRRLFLWPRSAGTVDLMVAREDSLFRYDSATETWVDLILSPVMSFLVGLIGWKIVRHKKDISPSPEGN